MRFSTVIPTWNEEFWLPRLLCDLKKARPSLSDVIVADNNSVDRTRLIAAQFGCRIVQGGTPAEGRNAGGRCAKEEVLLFIDADVSVPRSTFKLAALRLTRKETVAVHFPLIPTGGTRFVRRCYGVMDAYLRVLHRAGKAQGVGTFIAVRRHTFLEVGGFDEHLKVGEDADFIRRVGQLGEVAYDTQGVVYTSPRRFEIENPYLFAAKTVFWAALRLAGTKISVFPYRWAGYPHTIGQRDAAWLATFPMDVRPENHDAA